MLNRAEMRECVADTFSKILSPFTFFVWVSCSVITSVAGPFGTFEAMDWVTRSIFWVVVVTLSIFVGYAARAIAMIVVGPTKPGRFDLVAILAMTLIFTPVLWVFLIAVQRITGVVPPDLPTITVYVFLVSAGIFLMRRLAPGFETAGQVSSADNSDAPQKEPRLSRRLGEEVRGDILRLSASGHYIEVWTTNGSQKVRMRLVDAIAEMEPVPGYIIHRSHWITRSALIGIERENAHKVFVRLTNGDKVPVSRKFRPSLEAAGVVECAANAASALRGVRNQ